MFLGSTQFTIGVERDNIGYEVTNNISKAFKGIKSKLLIVGMVVESPVKSDIAIHREQINDSTFPMIRINQNIYYQPDVY